MAAGLGVKCPVAISGGLPPPKPFLPPRLRGRAVPATRPPRVSRIAGWEQSSISRVGWASALPGQSPRASTLLDLPAAWHNQSPGGLSAESLTRSRWACPSGTCKRGGGTDRDGSAPLSCLHPESLSCLPAHALPLSQASGIQDPPKWDIQVVCFPPVKSGLGSPPWH